MEQNSNTESQASPQHKKMRVTLLSILFTIFSICTYFADVVTDVLVAVRLYKDELNIFFNMTICFIAIPAITISSFSLCWYICDMKTKKLQISKTQWTLRGIFLITGMAPVMRNLEALHFASKSIKSKKDDVKEHFARRMTFENTDSSLLRLFEAFMECGPQLVIQIYVFAEGQQWNPNRYTKTEIIQWVSIFISLISMSSGIVFYLRTLRESLDNKNKLNYSTGILVFFWRFFEIMSRVMVLGLFASVEPHIFWIIMLSRFLFMTIWICTMNVQFCDNHWGEFIYNIVLAVMFTFCYFNPKDSPTRTRIIVYYTLVFIENSAMIGYWFYVYNPRISIRLPAMILEFVSFALGIALMVIYYYFFHPTRGKICGKGKPRESSSADEQRQANMIVAMLRDIEMNTEETSA